MTIAKRLTSLILACLLAVAPLAAIPAPATSLAEAGATVVPMSSGAMRFCSAVVVAPGKAYTAAHCIGVPGATVEQGGKALLVMGAVVPDMMRDVAVLDVPGLECPCAEPLSADAGRVPSGAPVAAIGYPAGQFRVTTGRMAGYLTIVHPNGMESTVLLASVRADPGNSGGGLFAVDGLGRVWLIGIVVAYLVTSTDGNTGVTAAEPLP